jgi:hypothetical protein
MQPQDEDSRRYPCNGGVDQFSCPDFCIIGPIEFTAYAFQDSFGWISLMLRNAKQARIRYHARSSANQASTKQRQG